MKLSLAFLTAICVLSLLIASAYCNISHQPSFELQSFAAEQDDSIAIVSLAVQVLHTGSLTATLETRTGFQCLNAEVRQSAVTADQVFTAEWPVEILGDGYHLIELSLGFNPEAEEDPPVIREQTFEIYVNVVDGIVTGSTAEPLTQFVAAAPFDSTEALAVAYPHLENPNQGETLFIVDVSGRITYTVPPDACYAIDPLRGIPGLRVVLDWDAGATPGSQSRPYGGGNVEGIDYAKTDQSGYFHFHIEFSYPEDYLRDITSFIRVYVQHINDAAFYGDNPNPLSDYFALYYDISVPTGTTWLTTSAANIVLERNHGGPMRFMERARQYAINQLGYTPARLRYYTKAYYGTHYCTSGQCANVPFSAPGRYINFQTYSGSNTAYHEYGHYIDDLFGGQAEHYDGTYHNFEEPSNEGVAWTEGWAEYFAAVTNEYWYQREPQLLFEREGLANAQFLDDWSILLDGLSSSVTKKTEGCVALYLYSLHDSYSARATNYSGDNDDLSFAPRSILDKVTSAEDSGPLSDMIPNLRNLFLASAPAAAASSLSALYNWTFAKTGQPRSPTPTTLNVNTQSGEPSLSWNNNASPASIGIPGGGATLCTYQIDDLYYNLPTSFRIWTKQTEGTWNGTLTDYSEVGSVAPDVFGWQDPSFDQPTSYVVVARNNGGQSLPSAERLVIPPAYFDAPLSGAQVSSVIDIVGTTNSVANMRGFSMSAPYDSFAVYWGSGSTPTMWHRYGIDYSTAKTNLVSHAAFGTWNTGVVPSGTYILRLLAYYGSASYETKRQVTVTHRAIDVTVEGSTSIRSAMNWAEPGDTIRVSGAHTVSILPVDLKISVQLMADGAAEINPTSSVEILRATDLKYPPTITGINFRRTAAAFSPASYCIHLDASALKLRNCTFDGQQASYGSAIEATGASNVSVENCEFTNTQRYQTYFGSVVDMQATSEGKPTGAFVNCLFRDNDVSAVSISYLANNPLQGSEPKPYFEGCRFEGNNCNEYVVKIANSQRTINLFTSTFVDNTLHAFDGTPSAVVYCDNAKVFFDNCTIANNDGSGVDAGAVSIGSTGSSPVKIDDSIITFNDGAVVNETNSGMPSDVTLTNCIVKNNASGSYRSDAQWVTAGTNVHEGDPAFYNAPNGDYSLYCFSPAVPGVNGESGLYFTTTIGADDAIHIPGATVSVTAGRLQDGVLLGCPGGETTYLTGTIDHLAITVSLDDNVMTRNISGSEVSILPPYLGSGIGSIAKIRGSALAEGNAENGYTVTLENANLAGSGSNQATVCLNGYPLTQTATISRRTPDYKSAGAPGPDPCTGDNMCADGKVTNADWSWFVTHYPTGANPGATYLAAADYVTPFGSPITLADLNWFVGHYTAAHKVSSTTTPLLLAGDPELIATTHVEFGFSEEYVTALQHRLYVDVTLEDCAGKNWCAFSLKTNRSDLSLSSWQPTSWAATSAPFVPIESEDGQLLFFGVIMINDTEESSRQLGRLVFDVQGSDPVTIGSDQFVLTMGELEIASNPDGEAFVFSGEPIFQHMSGVSGRQLNSTVQQVFHNSLSQNFPNPFNPQTTLAYSLHEATNVTLAIYDVAGRRVRELVNERRPAGAYKVVWDGTDAKGSKVASGVYFYKLVAGSFLETKKMVMLK